MKTKHLILLLVFLMAGFACQTDDNSPPKTVDPDNPSLEDEEVIVETSGIEINPDAQAILTDEWTQAVSVLDSTDFNLQMNEDLIKKHNLKPGTILVSDKGDGFLRKVKSISTASNGKVKVETEFCTLGELIKDGSFKVTVNSENDLRSAQAEFSNVNKIGIASKLDFVEVKGEYAFGRKVEFSASFKNYQLENLYFSFGFFNKLTVNAEVLLKGSGKVPLFAWPLHFPKFTILVGGVPVVVSTTLQLYLGAEVTIKPELLHLNFESGFESKAVMSYDGQWHFSASRDIYDKFQPPEFKLSDKINLKARVFIEPELKFKLYGVVGPYFSAKGFGEFDATYNKNPGWTASIGAELGGGIKGEIFMKNLFEYKVSSFFEAKVPILYGENYLSVSSGDGQQGVSGKKLPKPLTAKVTNTFGYPLSGYKVQFKSTVGSGKLSRTEATANADGEASVELTLNSDKNVIGHEVEASAIEKNDTPYKGEPLKDSPITFFSSVWNEEIDDTVWTFDLKSSQGYGNTSVSCLLKENGVAQIGTLAGTYLLNNNSLTVNWVANFTRPPGCTMQLRGTINGVICSGSYTHWDYDEKGTRFVWDSGTFTGYLSAII
jgi:hypothetical protein